MRLLRTTIALSVGLFPTFAVGWISSTTTSASSTIRTKQRTGTFTKNGVTRFLSSRNSSSSPTNGIDPQEFLERAKKLRQEIEAFEQQKNKLEKKEQQATQAELDKKQAFIDAYSVVIPILKPDGTTLEEAIFFPPTTVTTNKQQDNVKNDQMINSKILVLQVPLPMGILLGQDNDDGDNSNRGIVIDEVVDGSNGQAAGVQEGDIVRACTACRMEMSQPTWQLVVGGIGQPKTFRFMYGTDGQPLEKVMEAIGSNRMDPQGRPVILVVERPNIQK